jgi:hypothetical protein
LAETARIVEGSETVHSFLKLMGAFLLATTLGQQALAQGATVSSPVELARRSENLKPGQWVWAPEISPQGPLLVYVNLSTQRATVYRNGVRIAVSTVSSGKPGYETPTGVFTILEKDADHKSNTYNNAPMPFQQRLTWYGVALHAGGLPGYPESHGCVHLPYQFAKLLFNETDMGATVVIAGAADDPTLTLRAGVLAVVGIGGDESTHRPLAPDENYRWTPELAPTGPITIIVSRSDQRVVVMRNGHEIGRARAEIPRQDRNTHVFTYDGGNSWIAVGVPGHAKEAHQPVNIGVLDQLQLAPEFSAALNKEIVPGTTVLVTDAKVLPSNSGVHMAVLDGDEAAADKPKKVSKAKAQP